MSKLQKHYDEITLKLEKIGIGIETKLRKKVGMKNRLRKENKKRNGFNISGRKTQNHV